jgi:stage II sporulation protein R
MKKIICIILFISIMFGILGNKSFAKQTFEEVEVSSNEELKAAISNKLIRFHVLANSDSVQDQALKLKVRDRVLEYMTPILKKSNSVEESRELLKKEDNKIKELALQVIKDNGFDYKVQTTLSRENFPVKSYGTITLPQGEYEAYRILIGEGKGQNWWCVMFPPLCFVDITKSQTAVKETEKEMKKTFNDKEFNYIDNSINSNQGEPVKTKDLKVKFKIVEVIKGLIKK